MGVGGEKPNNWVDTHVSSRRVSGMGDQTGEEILPAGEGGWNVIIMKCRLGRDIG